MSSLARLEVTMKIGFKTLQTDVDWPTLHEAWELA